MSYEETPLQEEIPPSYQQVMVDTDATGML
jgi:hypothetical protein